MVVLVLDAELRTLFLNVGQSKPRVSSSIALEMRIDGTSFSEGNLTTMPHFLTALSCSWRLTEALLVHIESVPQGLAAWHRALVDLEEGELN